MEHPRSPYGTSDAAALLGRLAEHGVMVRSRRGRLVVDAPQGTPADLLDRFARTEEEIRRVVAGHPGLPGPRLPGPGDADGPFGLTDLQSAYQVGESDYPRLSTPAYLAHGFEVPGLDLA